MYYVELVYKGVEDNMDGGNGPRGVDEGYKCKVEDFPTPNPLEALHWACMMAHKDLNSLTALFLSKEDCYHTKNPLV